MYRLTDTATVVRLEDGAFIPAAPGNRDWREYQEWLAAGNAPEPAPTPEPSAPTVCSPAQGLVALYDLKGIPEDAISSAIEGIANPGQRYRARAGFRRAIEWRRDSDTMQALAAMLGLTDADLDELFAYAAGVNV